MWTPWSYSQQRGETDAEHAREFSGGICGFSDGDCNCLLLPLELVSSELMWTYFFIGCKFQSGDDEMWKQGMNALSKMVEGERRNGKMVGEKRVMESVWKMIERERGEMHPMYQCISRGMLYA